MPPKERYALIKAQVEEEVKRTKKRDENWENVIDVSYSPIMSASWFLNLTSRIRTKHLQCHTLLVYSSISLRREPPRRIHRPRVVAMAVGTRAPFESVLVVVGGCS